MPFITPPAGYAFALILFFGRGRGRGGRATAKPTVSRRTSADGFAVKMERTKAGQGCQILFPVFGGEMATAKIKTVKGEAWRFFRTREKILLGFDGLDSRNGVERGLFSKRECAILEFINRQIIIVRLFLEGGP